jgi:hypothetical protein
MGVRDLARQLIRRSLGDAAFPALYLAILWSWVAEPKRRLLVGLPAAAIVRGAGFAAWMLKAACPQCGYTIRLAKK